MESQDTIDARHKAGEAFIDGLPEQAQRAVAKTEAMGGLVIRAERAVDEAHPETVAQEQAEFAQEVKADVTALPNEVAEAPVQDNTPVETPAA